MSESPSSYGGEPTPPPPPALSPDGKFWWDGERWSPLTTGNERRPDITDGVAAGVLKALLVVLFPLAVLALLVVMGITLALGLLDNLLVWVIILGVPTWLLIRWRRRASARTTGAA